VPAKRFLDTKKANGGQNPNSRGLAELERQEEDDYGKQAGRKSDGYPCRKLVQPTKDARARGDAPKEQRGFWVYTWPFQRGRTKSLRSSISAATLAYLGSSGAHRSLCPRNGKYKRKARVKITSGSKPPLSAKLPHALIIAPHRLEFHLGDLTPKQRWVRIWGYLA